MRGTCKLAEGVACKPTIDLWPTGKRQLMRYLKRTNVKSSLPLVALILDLCAHERLSTQGGEIYAYADSLSCTPNRS